MVLRRSILGTIFSTILRRSKKNVNVGTISAQDLQYFLGNPSSQDKYLRQQFRKLTQGTRAFEYIFARSSENNQSMLQCMNRAEFIRIFAEGTDILSESNFQGQSSKKIENTSASSSTDNVTRNVNSPLAKNLQMKHLNTIFDHYTGAKPWKEQSYMKLSAWNNFVHDADRCHDSSAPVIVDNVNLSPADLDIIFATVGNKGYCTSNQQAPSNSGVVFQHGASKPTSPHVNQVRFNVHAFLIAIKLLFTRRFQNELSSDTAVSSRLMPSDETPTSHSSHQSVRSLLQRCLHIYLLPLYDDIMEQQQELKPKGMQQNPIHNQLHNEHGTAILNQVVHEFRESFGKNAGVQLFFQKHVQALHSIFLHFAQCRTNISAVVAAAKRRARSQVNNTPVKRIMQ